MQWCKPFEFLSMSSFSSLSFSHSLSILSFLYRSSLISFKSILFFLYFLRNIPFCTFSFLGGWKQYFFKPYPCSLQKKLKFKRVSTLPLRITTTCHVLISMHEPCKRMSLFCFRFCKILFRKERYFMLYMIISLNIVYQLLHVVDMKWLFRNIMVNFKRQKPKEMDTSRVVNYILIGSQPRLYSFSFFVGTLEN